MTHDFSIIAVVQAGRLAHEALLFMASLRAVEPDVSVLLFEPQPGPNWRDDPRISDDIRKTLLDLGADIQPIAQSTWGQAYPNGNKVDALCAAPSGRNFVFFDTDTLFLKPFDIEFPFIAPTASLRREATWPKPDAFSRAEIWSALYQDFGIDISPSLDATRDVDDWERNAYFNAGFFCGADARAFGQRMRAVMLEITNADLPELKGQALFPWLDQIALPLVIAERGGGRNDAIASAMDEDLTCHWRVLALAYAREAAWKLDCLEQVANSPAIKPLLEKYPPFAQLVFDGAGRQLRDDLAGQTFATEQPLRKAIRSKGLWLR